MTIDEITSQVRRHTYGVLNDGEVVRVVETLLQTHGGIDPDDVESVCIGFNPGGLNIQFVLKENARTIL